MSVNLQDGRPSLLPMDEAAAGYAFHLASEAATSWPRLYLAGVSTLPQFSSALWEGVEAMWIVADEQLQGRGVAAIHDIEHRHGTGFVELVRQSGQGDVGEATFDQASRLVIDYAFTVFNLRKVYCRHIGDSPPPLASLGDLAIEEGRLREYVYHDNFYWDLVVTSVSRSDWTRP